MAVTSLQETATGLDVDTNVSRSCRVLDSFLASTKALHIAVSVANVVLSIEHCIQDL